MLSSDALAFLSERHLAVLSTVGRRGRVHAVPVGMTYRDGVARVIGSRGTQKFVNAARSGRAVVTTVDGARWLSLEGPAVVVDDAAAVADAVALYTARYRAPRANPDRVVLEIAVEKVLGSSGMRA
ncbi:pyridoxamine 5'-phosphate oxidase family protein [Microbacterium sp. NPDC055683]